MFKKMFTGLFIWVLLLLIAMPMFASPRKNTGINVGLSQVWLAPAATSYNFYTSSKTFADTITNLMAGATVLALANGDYADSVYPRNVVAVAASTFSVTVASYSATLTIFGEDYSTKLFTTETLTLSIGTGTTTGFNICIATGNIAWSTISSFTVVTSTAFVSVPTAKIGLNIATGAKFGLGNRINDYTDILKVIENGAKTTTYVIDANYNTITFGTAPNASDNKQVLYIGR